MPHVLRFGKSSLSRLLLLAAACCAAPSAVAQEPRPEPLVARLQMQIKSGEELLDVIHKGDLLTVVEEREKGWVILSAQGKRGLVAKVNAVRLAEAVEIYDELLKEEPKSARLHSLRASAWWARGDEKQALADYDKAVQLGPEDPTTLASRGMFHAALRRYEPALADLTLAIQKQPKEESFYINRAAVHLATRQFDEAIADYTSAIALNKRPTTLQQRAVAHKSKGNLQGAVFDFTQAIEEDAKFLPGIMGRGFVYFQMGEHRKAIDDFTRAIALEPSSALAYNNRGYNLLLLRDYTAALADYDKAIALAPEYGLSYQNKAWLLAAAPDDGVRDGEHALKAATKACELSKYQAAGDLRALAAAFAELGQFEKAIGWQEKAIALLPKENTEALDQEKKVLEGYQDKRPFRLVITEE